MLRRIRKNGESVGGTLRNQLKLSSAQLPGPLSLFFVKEQIGAQRILLCLYKNITSLRPTFLRMFIVHLTLFVTGQFVIQIVMHEFDNGTPILMMVS